MASNNIVPDAALWSNRNLLAAAQRFQNDERFTDFTIACDEKEYNVHSCLIAPHSKYFERCFSGLFKESTDRKVDLQGDDPYVVKMMIKWFYTSDYVDKWKASEPKDEDFWPLSTPLVINAHMYSLADKYDVPDLKVLALEKFMKGLVASYKCGKDMVAAAFTLTVDISLPDSDTALYDVFVDAWLLGGRELFADISSTAFEEIIHAAPWLSVALTTRALQGINPTGLRGYFKCGRYESLPHASALTGASVLCKTCKIPISTKGRMTLTSTLEVKRFW